MAVASFVYDCSKVVTRPHYDGRPGAQKRVASGRKSPTGKEKHSLDGKTAEGVRSKFELKFKVEYHGLRRRKWAKSRNLTLAALIGLMFVPRSSKHSEDCKLSGDDDNSAAKRRYCMLLPRLCRRCHCSLPRLLNPGLLAMRWTWHCFLSKAHRKWYFLCRADMLSSWPSKTNSTSKTTKQQPQMEPGWNMMKWNCLFMDLVKLTASCNLEVNISFGSLQYASRCFVSFAVSFAAYIDSFLTGVCEWVWCQNSYCKLTIWERAHLVWDMALRWARPSMATASLRQNMFTSELSRFFRPAGPNGQWIIQIHSV